MDKVLLIFRREFLSRVRKRSFLITTILVPLIIPAILAGFLWLMLRDAGEAPERVFILDESGKVVLKNNKKFEFDILQGNLEVAKAAFTASEHFALLHIPNFDLSDAKGFELYTRRNPGLDKTKALEKIVSERVRDLRLESYNIDNKTLQSIKKEIRFTQKVISETGEETGSNTGLLNGIGMAMGILIYMLVLLYGIQIMHGVIEEKSSKVVEVLVSTVRPFQLMLGKITGIAAVGLVQFAIWIVLLYTVTGAVTAQFGLDTKSTSGMEQMQQEMNNSLEGAESSGIRSGEFLDSLNQFRELPLGILAFVFLFYFIGGYLLYGALFAAVGSAVDTVQEAQQFQFPVTLPLFAAYLGLFSIVLRDPHSASSFWLSVIPFTAPVAMVGRIGFGVPAWELALSMVSLVAGFLFTTWVAARIYRVGILMTGTKVTWKTLLRWATMKV